MPQLNPAPWFLIFLTSWLTLLLLSPIKITKYQLTKSHNQEHIKATNKPWLWPWP